MEDLLTGGFPVRDKEVDPFAAQAGRTHSRCHPLRDHEEMRTKRLVEIGERRGMLARNDEQVTGSPRREIHERDRAIVLVREARLLAAGEDLAEDAAAGQTTKLTSFRGTTIVCRISAPSR